jgi:hypothetical protein
MSVTDTDTPLSLIPNTVLRRESQRQLHLRLLAAQIEYHLAYAQLAKSLGEVCLMRAHLKATERSLQVQRRQCVFGYSQSSGIGY